jgi:NAD(P)-dependent dehydrogenase (short-subunit alcohol dehydrogenase family)
MNKTVLITGANRGIGLALTKLCAKRGDKVYAVCRNSSKALDALNVNVLTDINVAEKPSIIGLKLAMTGIKIDLLINNAGLLISDQLVGLKSDPIRQQLEVNAIAPLMVTEALLENLGSGSKVAMISSRMGSIADNQSGKHYGYRMSKAALNAGAKSLALDVKERNIAVGVYHPGFVQTDMVHHQGDISADESAKRLLALMEQLTMAESGVFKHANGELLPW